MRRLATAPRPGGVSGISSGWGSSGMLSTQYSVLSTQYSVLNPEPQTFLAVNRLAVTGGVKIFERSHQRAAATLVKRSGGMIVRLRGSLDVNIPAAFPGE